MINYEIHCISDLSNQKWSILVGKGLYILWLMLHLTMTQFQEQRCLMFGVKFCSLTQFWFIWKIVRVAKGDWDIISCSVIYLLIETLTDPSSINNKNMSTYYYDLFISISDCCLTNENAIFTWVHYIPRNAAS